MSQVDPSQWTRWFWLLRPRPIESTAEFRTTQSLQDVHIDPAASTRAEECSEKQPLLDDQDEEHFSQPHEYLRDGSQLYCHPLQLPTSHESKEQVDTGLLDTTPYTYHSRHHNKGLFRLLGLVNVLVLMLILLFCVAVLNLLSWSTWPSMTTKDIQASSADSAPTTGSSRSTSSNGRPSVDQSSSPESESPFTALINNHRKPGHRDQPKLPLPAKRIPRPLTLHNETLIDNYRWMHYIDQDPDVETYIKAETEYTNAWVEQSGTKALQKQLEHEMAQIRSAMARQPILTGPSSPRPPPVDSVKVSEHMKPHEKQRLEGTQFWDLDSWRYWLDDSVGDYGVYKRRPISRNTHGIAPPTLANSLQSQTALSGTSFKKKADGNEDRSSFDAKGCSSDPVSSAEVQLVLDVNRLAKKQIRKKHGKQLTIGSVEIQPKETILGRDGAFMEGLGYHRMAKSEDKDIYMAYTYGVSGGERYYIQIATLSADTDAKTAKEAEAMDKGHLLMIKNAAIKDAGSFVRWVKLDESLYLYFTRLDKKGLPREVWRVKVDGPKEDDSQLDTQAGKDKPKYEPEMVMQEKNGRNILSVSYTSDQRFLLIESSGQTNSHTYFLSIDSPEKGWSLVHKAMENVIYKVEHHSGYFYLHTNHDGATNFKVIRIPVNYYSLGSNRFQSAENAGPSFLCTGEYEVVIPHDPNEFLERLEVFVEHFVAWVWRGGLQEIRIFLAPRPGRRKPKIPLSEAQRIRPYHRDSKIATVMPENVRNKGQRLYIDYYSTKLRYSNSSFIRPWAVYEFDMHSVSHLPTVGGDDDGRVRNATRLVCQEPFPLGVRYGQSSHLEQESITEMDPLSSRLESPVMDPREKQEKEMAKFKEERIMVPSRHRSKRNRTCQADDCNNGDQEKETLIPVSLVYRAFPDGRQFPRRAAFVEAYGAYGKMTTPAFDPLVVLPLLHRGLLFVQIHPRGDGIMGPEWYADGKAEHKLNTFYDVEDVLLYLRDSGMVEKGGVVMEGRSAGGLVSGWIANRWGEVASLSPGEKIGDVPESGSKNIVREMVNVVLAQVPFMDVIADMADPDIPWVEYEWDEWGSPLQSREVFEVMKAYSPYDRIRNQPYPPMMIMGGLADGRVSYAEPLKYVAKLRSIDGKTNDCQPFDNKDEEELEDSRWDVSSESEEEERDRMCAGKKDTPLLLQMEDGGRFSGNSSLWMAFSLYHLGAEKVMPFSAVAD
ncbi:hypothetical protein BC939DRAFT_182079 [Gamsiella multidivaricata]|uniref:uncharacterized protein n=1 Tax=Gamsiella multidivaricata TaxID=101098 RepID=UPI00221F167A|nr:uncharacterized protein BC939DRAFT_182079 [Gamsiella multidivaricata]KAG0366209.1 hypothetical protein BGZ54_005666 [Gamsiella multidivaricata]KAI7822350.1 hypothetical protein BC939DRAFT_182079 [Gamsiella multidivaricata]